MSSVSKYPCGNGKQPVAPFLQEGVFSLSGMCAFFISCALVLSPCAPAEVEIAENCGGFVAELAYLPFGGLCG